LPNRDIFQEIYPDSDSPDSSSESEDDDDDGTVEDGPELKAVKKELSKLRDEHKRAKEIIASADSRLKILDAHGKMLDRRRGVEIDKGLETYRAEREKVFQDHMAGTIRDRELTEEILDLGKKESQLFRAKLKEQRKLTKAKAKIQQAKDKKKAQEKRREEEKRKEQGRVKKERENFWPRQCYTIRITLDATSFTPMSSRRGSVSSASDLVKMPAEKDVQEVEGSSFDSTCDLALTYVASSAFWSPTYDLQMSTTSNTAMLCFDARLTNMTSETWKNCRVTLSTSQTAFSGLNDVIPTLTPWRVKLAKGRGYEGVLLSNEETSQKAAWVTSQHWVGQKPRTELFGVGASKGFPFGSTAPNFNGFGHRQQQANQFPAQQPFQTAFSAPRHAAGGGLFGHSNTQSRGLGASAPAPAPGQAAPAAFGSAAVPPPPQPQQAGIFGGSMKKGSKRAGVPADEDNDTDEAGESGGWVPPGEAMHDDGETILENPVPELEFQESSFEETGMTTTYDLPGTKTLAPTSTASKQRVARISFNGVVFSHTIVAKYKPAAFLKAKLRNASKLTLLKGPVGLTLDGSFMGRSSLPRCSAGDSFTMSLGIDPAIRVAYPKPDVKRSTTGMFAKEDNAVYKRFVTITNTRGANSSAAKPISITVLDQVPVSEDEKLRIDIHQPRGMTFNGNAVATGSSPRDEKDWGKAVASLKKAGEIMWDVTLQPGRSVKLPLEYEVAVPSGEGVIQC